MKKPFYSWDGDTLVLSIGGTLRLCITYCLQEIALVKDL
jgi:hypothetical protein